MNSWDDLLYALKKGQCILVLGSGVSTGKEEDGTERPITELLANHLCDQMERKNLVVEGNRKNLFQIANEFVHHFGHTALERETEGFYQRDAYARPNPIQTALAALPFHLILSAAPDKLFYKALVGNNKNPEMVHYMPPGTDRAEVHKNLVKPSVSNPLVYNMLGVWDDPGSVILTESAQLDYLQDVIRHSDAIPNSLLEICKAEKGVFVFLGFDFERWQLRLLLRALKLGGEDINHWAIQRPDSLQKDTMLFFKDQYGVHFMDMDSAAFVEELSQRCRENVPAESAPAAARLRAVCLYAQEDEPFRHELDAHLAPLREHQQVETWDEACLLPGEAVSEATQKAIDAAHLIIILASADFIQSEEHYHDQLGRAIQRFEAHQAKIFPIMVRRFAWEDTLFDRLPIKLPQENGVVKPVAEWEQRDTAYAGIVSLILRHVKFLLEDLKSIPAT